MADEPRYEIRVRATVDGTAKDRYRHVMVEGPAIQRASARTLRPLMLGLAGHGVATEPVFCGAGIEPSVLSDPDARLPASAVHELWRQSAELSGNPNFGLTLSRHIKPGSFDVLDYLARNATTVGAGLQQYCRYTQLLHDGIKATVDAGPTVAKFRHVLRDGTTIPRQYAEFIIASILVIARQASGVHLEPQRVHFLHAAPSSWTMHREIFGSKPVFGSDCNGFELRRSDYDRPLHQAQEGLFLVLKQHADRLLQEAPRPSTLIAQVRATIAADLHNGNVSARSVAESLGTSERTLRRRLDADGTNYQQVLSGLRTELAIGYMDEERLSTDEVALLLGFSDRTAFNRAFRQWTGRTPAEFRAIGPRP